MAALRFLFCCFEGFFEVGVALVPFIEAGDVFLFGDGDELLVGVVDGIGQGPVSFTVAHAGFVGAVEEIPVGYIEVNAPGATPLIKIGNGFELVPLGIVKAAMAGVPGRGADVTGVRTIVFEQVETGFFVKSIELAKVILAPLALDTGGISKSSEASEAAGLGIDNIMLIADAAGGEQGIAAQFDAFRVGIIG